jgi:hypothetical protein
MPHMNLKLDGDGAFSHIDRDNVIHIDGEKEWIVALLKGGMASGKDSVALGMELPDGRYLIAETSAELFKSAARAIEARQSVQ